MADVTSRFLSNRNFFVPLQAEFVIRRLPDVFFFTQAVNVPGVAFQTAQQQNPLVDIKHPGDVLMYDELRIVFKIDEYLTNYMSVLDWMTALGFPESPDQHRQLADKPIWSGEGKSSDGTLILLSNKGNAKVEVEFSDLFPVGLSGIDVDTRESSVQYLTATATFAYTSYKIQRLRGS